MFVLDKNEPTRFYYGTDQKEWVDILLLEEEDLQPIRDSLGIKPLWDYRPNTAKDNLPLEPVLRMLEPKVAKAFAEEVDYAGIPAWCILDGDGKEIPRTKENVALMMSKCRAFNTFVEESRKKLKQDLKAASEAEIKN